MGSSYNTEVPSRRNRGLGLTETVTSRSPNFPAVTNTTPGILCFTMIGAASFMAFIYSLCERYLPMGEGDQHVFWPWPWIKKHDHDEHDGDGDHDVSEGEVLAGVPAEAEAAV